VNKLDVEIESDFSDYTGGQLLTIQVSSAKRITLEKANNHRKRNSRFLGSTPIGQPAICVRPRPDGDRFFEEHGLPGGSLLRIGEYYHMFNELNFFDVQLKRLRRITTYDIMESAKKYLLKEPGHLNVYGD